MKIGVPREIKTLEGRVALIPSAAGQLVSEGHEVYVEKGAGRLSGYSDEAYRSNRVQLVDSAEELFATSQLIVKVKEPQPTEVAMLREDHLLFSYLHLAAATDLMQDLLDIGLTAVAFETVETDSGALPLLAPMSDIAGRVAVQVGAHYLHQPQGGKGLLLGGLPAAERGHVVVLGGGVAGGNATAMAAGIGAQVTVFDRNREKLAHMRSFGNNVTALYPYPDALREAVINADLLVGAVLVTGERAPHLVSADTVAQMTDGSVIIDISVDQGGCIETTRPTNYAEPTYMWEGIVHFAVTNMPGAVPRSASQALSAVLLPYVLALSEDNWDRHAGLRAGVNVSAGKVVYPVLAENR